ncbi:YdeI/OmpD-associated family protein [Microbacterium sp. P04]|uniref:YdeI/OmpD-associated family protein n=1 Tax=Microbacterium sp. P04 TaxID=3366947 RepID=UPI0037468C5B
MRFDTRLLLQGKNTGIEVPPEILTELGGGKRPAVRVVVNGFAFRSTVGAMGGRALIPFSADKRAQTGLSGGDPISVEISLDDAPREVAVPDDLAAALAALDVREAFEALSPSARKAQVAEVEGAVGSATRTRRIARIAAKLLP